MAAVKAMGRVGERCPAPVYVDFEIPIVLPRDEVMQQIEAFGLVMHTPDGGGSSSGKEAK